MDCLFEEIDGVGGNIGLITLNRPQALNALTQAMCVEMNAHLSAWEQRAEIKAVIVTGAGDKAFCAGGDIRAIYDLGKAHAAQGATFFQDEYRLNRHIHHYTKPYIAILDGITMGGGVGISVHGSHRVASERLILAMPETAIGFFPDVGGTYVLPRCPETYGVYLALTGARINALEAKMTGFATDIVRSDDLPKLTQTLAATAFAQKPHATISQILASFAQESAVENTLPPAEEINQVFRQATVEDMLTQLNRIKTLWADASLKKLEQCSPMSLKVTLKQLQLGGSLDFDACMRLELQLAQRFIHDHDFYEGVRALLINKDYKPHWQPARLSAVTSKMVEAYFEPKIGDIELD